MSRRSPRGFTLIELMVALGMALAVTIAAVTVMVLAVRTQQSGARRNELSRNAQIVMDVIARDLSYLGAGVPRGFEANHNGTLNGIGVATLDAETAELDARAAKQLRPPIRIGHDDYIAFLGDAPYPNADINGIAVPGVFSDSGATARSHRVQVTSELSPCGAPFDPGDYDCESTAASIIRNVGGDDCDKDTLGAATCPWGLGKWQKSGTHIQLLFSAVDGSWYRRRWDRADKDKRNGRLVLHLAHQPDGKEADLPIFRFHEAGVGGGMVATLDRVVYSLEKTSARGTGCGGTAPCTLWRRQCWGWGAGSADPDDGSFPAVNGTVGRSTDASFPLDCTAPNQGTPWERVMDGIKELRFRYYAADDLKTTTPLTTPLSAEDSAATRVVEIEVVLGVYTDPDGDGTFTERQEDDGAPPLEHRLVRRIWLENGGGLVTYPERVSPASGGCAASAAVPNECNPQ